MDPVACRCSFGEQLSRTRRGFVGFWCPSNARSPGSGLHTGTVGVASAELRRPATESYVKKHSKGSFSDFLSRHPRRPVSSSCEDERLADPSGLLVQRGVLQQDEDSQ